MTGTYPRGLAADATHEIGRPRSEPLDAILGHAFGALDHGFVRVIDYMGDQSAITQAARVSYGEGTKTVNEDHGLIRYLMRNRHTTPFEMCELKLHVKLPIFVARQWVRHRTAHINEYSGRYSVMKAEFHVPKSEQLAAQSSSNKQGRGTWLPEDEAALVQKMMWSECTNAFESYKGYMNTFDLSRELARINLPLSTYTEWYWKIDLHNLLHFLALRADPHAQYEIRVYADIICGIVESWVPAVWQAFEDYVVNAHTFSAQEMTVLRKMLTRTYPGAIRQEIDALSGSTAITEREKQGFLEAIQLDGV